MKVIKRGIKDYAREGMRTGAIVVGTFLALVGGVFAVTYGGFLGVMIANAVAGQSLQPTILDRVIIAAFMIISFVVVVALAGMLGGGLGWAIGYCYGHFKQIKTDYIPAEEAEEEVADGYEIETPATIKKLADDGLKAGAWVGILLFLTFGLMAGVFYGGAGGLMIANKVFGMAAQHTLAFRLVTLLGIIFGVVATASIFMVVGSLLGGLTGMVLDTIKGFIKNIATPDHAKEKAKS